MPPVWSPISDYAIIGDCRSAALISKNGSIDWLCLPRFDSPSIFAALLDPERGGRFSIRPTQPFTATRRYVDNTNVLETTFVTETGTVRLTDLMPVESEAQKEKELFPDHELLRKIQCDNGTVEIETIFDPRPDFGRVIPMPRHRGALGYFYEHGQKTIGLKTDIEISEPGLRGRFTLQAGEQRYFSVVFSHGYPMVLAPLGAAADTRISRSIEWWNSWASQIRYNGPYRDAVTRSALALKLLTYAPSGAIVAAPTTSLPEKIGGVRNWDYRYCWLRDGSFTVRALLDLGFTVEGEAYLGWLLHATRLTWPALQIVYDVYGESHLPERELPHLSGYRESKPVRLGNDAARQLQLDTYGEVVEATYQYVIRGGPLDRTTGRMLVGLGKTVCRRWREPDEGIWEPRHARQNHTHSIAMCWVALDRLIKLHMSGHVRAPLPLFEREIAAIRHEVETRGYNSRIRSYVAVLDGDAVDASLLVLGLNGFSEPGDPRMRDTYRQIRERLGVDGLLYRYLSHDGLPPGEGTFGICAFWAVELLARQGELQTARKYFEQLLSFMNDVGLYAEEIDPDTGAALGNFPQAFTHVGLINAAVALSSEGS